MGEESAEAAAGAVGFEVEGDGPVQGDLFEVLRGGVGPALSGEVALGLSGLGGVDAPEADAGVGAGGGLAGVGGVDDEGVAVDDAEDGEGLAVVAVEVGSGGEQ